MFYSSIVTPFRRFAFDWLPTPIIVTFAAFAALTPIEARGQSGETQTQQLEEVVVVAQRREFLDSTITSAAKLPLSSMEIPHSVSLMSEDFLEIAAINDLGTLADYSVGATKEEFSGQGSKMRARGFELSNTSGYKLDGFFYVRQQGGNDINLSALDRVEFVRGPASVMYGESPPSGIVNLVLKDPLPSFAASASATVGRYDYFAGEFDVGGPLTEDGDIRYRTTAYVRQNETNEQFVEEENLNLFAALEYDLGTATELSVDVWYDYGSDLPNEGYSLFSDGTLPEDGVGGVDRDAFIGNPDWVELEWRFLMLAATLDHRTSNDINLRFRASHIDDDQPTVNNTFQAFFTDPSGVVDGIVGAVANYENQSLMLEAQAFQNFELFGQDDNLWYIGVDFRDYEFIFNVPALTILAGPELNILTPEGLRAIQSVPRPPAVSDSNDLSLPDYQLAVDTRKATGLNAQLLLKPWPRVSILAGVRWDQIEITRDDQFGEAAGDLFGQFDSYTEFENDEVLGRIGITYELTEQLNLYANWSESYEPQDSFVADESGQPLDAQIGRQYEVGAKVRLNDGRLVMTGAYFDIDQDNLPFIVTTFPTVFAAAGLHNHRGLEFELIGSPTEGLNVYLTYAYLDATIKNSDVPEEIGNRPLGTAEHTASALFSYEFLRGSLAGLGVGAGWRYVSARAGDNMNTFEYPSYSLADFTVYYSRTPKWLFQLNVTNAFDRSYLLDNGFGFGGFGGHNFGRPTQWMLQVERTFGAAAH